MEIKKELKNQILNKKNSGITLIALVVTIVLLLILAGISISTLTSEDSIITEAEENSEIAEIESFKEKIKAEILQKQKKTKKGITDAELEAILAKYADKDAGGNAKITNTGTTIKIVWNEIEVDLTETINQVRVYKEGLDEDTTPPTVQNHEISPEDGKAAIVTISIHAKDDSGIKSITNITTENIERVNNNTFEVTKNGDYTFEIMDNAGNVMEEHYKVSITNVEQIYALKVGDYITGYTLKDTTQKSVQTEIANLNTEVNSYSGYTSTQALSQDTNIQWRVLEIDEATGQPTKLISADNVGSLELRGAKGYNNAVYLLDKVCEVLYSGEQGTAESIKIEDLEKHYTEAGKKAVTNFNSGVTPYRSKNRFTDPSYRYYPQIALEENGIGINTSTITENGTTYNQVKTDGIGLSDKGNAPYTETETLGGAYDQAGSNGMTITQTYYAYYVSSALIYETDSVYYDLFHKVSSNYWMASRCVDAYSNDSYCTFRVFHAYSSGIGSYLLFYSRGSSGGGSRGLRPVINLKSDTQAEYVGESSKTGYNTFKLK